MIALSAGARIQLKHRGENISFLKERVVEVSGSAKSCIKAVDLSLRMLVDDDAQENPAGINRYHNMTTSYSRILTENGANPESHYGHPSHQEQHHHHRHLHLPEQQYHHQQHQNQQQESQEHNSLYHHEPSSLYSPARSTPTVTVKIPVANNLVGEAYGKVRMGLANIQSVSGATISLSPPPLGAHLPGTSRTITIMGEPLQVQGAAALVKAKIETASSNEPKPFLQAPQPFQYTYEPVQCPHPFSPPSQTSHAHEQQQQEQGFCWHPMGSPSQQHRGFLSPPVPPPENALTTDTQQESHMVPPWL
jgi:hypothetical protein